MRGNGGLNEADSIPIRFATKRKRQYCEESFVIRTKAICPQASRVGKKFRDYMYGHPARGEVLLFTELKVEEQKALSPKLAGQASEEAI